jgi:hypothetical protein
MKKKIFVIVIGLIVFAIVLAACSKTSTAASAALAEDTKLMVGTMKLDGTAQVVTADQANTLLPLWQAYQSLANSSTAAQAEKDALLKQIKGAMAADQIKAIDAMNLKESDTQTLFQQTGFNPTYEGTRVARTPSSNLQIPSGGETGRGAGGPSGGGVMIFGGGDFANGAPDGSGFSVNGMSVTPDPARIATAQAARSNMASSPFMYNLIIRYLEGKITAK